MINLIEILCWNHRSAEKPQIYIYKEDCLCLSLSFCLNAFAQFSRYEVQTSQTGQGLSGAGCGGVDDSTVPQGAQK